MPPAGTVQGYHNLKKLGDEKWLKIRNELMTTRKSALGLAQEIQQEWGDLQQVRERTLAQQLNRLRNDLGKGNYGADLQGIHNDAEAQEERSINLRQMRGTSVIPIQEMNALANIQRNRLQRFLDKEATMPLPMTSVNALITDYRGTLESLQKLRFENGVDKYQGVITGMRSKTEQIVNPDGSTQTQTLFEAFQTANEVFKTLSIKGHPTLPNAT